MPKEERAQREWHMSQYERGQRGNALSGDGPRLPSGGNTSAWAKGLRTLGGLRGCLGGRLDKTGVHADDGLRRRGCGQTRSGGGVYEPAFKPLHDLGRPAADMLRFQTGLGKSDRPGLWGGVGKRAPWWECAPASQSKER